MHCSLKNYYLLNVRGIRIGAGGSDDQTAVAEVIYIDTINISYRATISASEIHKKANL